MLDNLALGESSVRRGTRNSRLLNISVDNEITLKVLEENDAEALYRHVDAHRAYMREWLPWVDSEQSPADTKRFIQLVQQQYRQHEGLQTGIWYNGEIAGVIGYHRFDWPNRATSIGYWLSKEFQGHGIMTRSCRALVDYAFGELGLHRVEIRCAVGNLKSRAIPERLGFRVEGTAREAEWLYDHFVDLIVYAMLDYEWREKKKRNELP
ncbi:MAG TPA: GNAT family protein [Bacteroidota bacterium]|nr:GNAT family protein [Bacteroidota bacterium]